MCLVTIICASCYSKVEEEGCWQYVKKLRGQQFSVKIHAYLIIHAGRGLLDVKEQYNFLVFVLKMNKEKRKAKKGQRKKYLKQPCVKVTIRRFTMFEIQRAIKILLHFKRNTLFSCCWVLQNTTCLIFKNVLSLLIWTVCGAILNLSPFLKLKITFLKFIHSTAIVVWKRLKIGINS